MSARKVKSTQSINVALVKFVASASTALEKAEAQFDTESPALTGAEKRRAAKFRKGGDRIVETVGAMGKQYGLDSAALHSDTMLGRLHDAQALIPLQQRFEKVLKRITDEIFRAHGESWQQAREFYAMLQTRAKVDGEVAKNLAPVASFFSYRHPSKTQGKPTKRQRHADSKAKKALKQLGLDASAPAASHTSINATVNLVGAPDQAAPRSPAPAPAPTPPPAPAASSTPAASSQATTNGAASPAVANGTATPTAANH